jgi:hypothetical protein
VIPRPLVGGGSVVNLMAVWRAHGLGLLPYSNGVHDSLGDQPRRRVYRECVANGELPGGGYHDEPIPPRRL